MSEWTPDSEPWTPDADKEPDGLDPNAGIELRYFDRRSKSQIEGDNFPAAFVLVLTPSPDGRTNIFTSLATAEGYGDHHTKLIMRGVFSYFLSCGFTPEMLTGFIEATAIAMPSGSRISHEELIRRRREAEGD